MSFSLLSNSSNIQDDFWPLFSFSINKAFLIERCPFSRFFGELALLYWSIQNLTSLSIKLFTFIIFVSDTNYDDIPRISESKWN